MDKLFELSEGVLVETSSGEDEPTVYRTPPDRQALTYLVDRIMGKPPQALEHSGPNGGEMVFTIQIDRRDDDDDAG